jgi:hypothetical protein
MEANLLPLLMQKAGEGEVCCYGDAPAGVRLMNSCPGSIRWC